MASATVLVVEDEPISMVVAQAVLRVGGYAILKARTAADGIALARSERPDLILMDIGLPIMDGLAATRALKADPDTARIPVVALTVNALWGDREKCLAAGCDGYVSKPYDVQRLLGVVARLLAHGRRREGAIRPAEEARL